MSDCFVEQLVKRRQTIGTTLKKSALISLTIVFGIMSIFGTLYFLLFIGMIILDSFVLKRFNVEYEYVYFNGDLDIDKIMNKENRKRMFSTNIKEIQLVAPAGAMQLQSFQTVRTLNFSSCNPGNKTYEMIVAYKGDKVKVIFEPNEEILNAMKLLAPGKVVV